MSKCIVTGGRGYIGSKLCAVLKEQGHEVIVIDNAIGVTIANSYFRDVDVVYHLAAQADVQYSRINPYYDAINNIGSTIEIITKYPKAKIIYAASAASLEINSPYGLSKKVCEDYIKLLCTNYAILRIPNPWGDNGHGAVDYFLKADVIKVRGNGLQSRTIVHVSDIINAFVKAMNWDTGEYHLGGDERFNLTVKEIAERISKKTGSPIEYDLDYDPEKNGEVFAAILSNTTPDWQPMVEL